ncbi:hypothetical protein FBU30_000989 [Linnemannia zychae]|nr:hypothetical protein FBU30_000989 [Linnemannia zychae]
MKNLHTLEFLWTPIPLIVSRGLAPPGQQEELWSLLDIEGVSKWAEMEVELRTREENQMILSAEKAARQALSEGNSTSVSGYTPALDWICYRAMYPMRRQQILHDLISARAFKMYVQERIRYRNDLVQEAASSNLDAKELARRNYTKSRCGLQEIFDSIVAHDKQSSTVLQSNTLHNYQVYRASAQIRKNLQAMFRTQLERLESDEAELSGNLEPKSYTIKPTGTSAIFDGLVIYYSGEWEASIMNFCKLSPALRVIRDYSRYISSESIFDNTSDYEMPSSLASLRHLSWSISGGYRSTSFNRINKSPLYQRQLHNFLKSPFLCLESLRLSLLSLSSFEFLFNKVERASTTKIETTPDCDDSNGKNAKAIQRAGPILSLTQLFIEDPMVLQTLVRSDDCNVPCWVPFLKRCPNLSSLALGSCPPLIWFEVARVLQAHCPRLENLAIAYGGRQANNQLTNKCDPALAALLFACSHPHIDDTFGQDDDTVIEEPIEPAIGLKRLRLDAFVLPPKSQALRMLLDYHSGSMTHLGIMDCSNLQKKHNRSTLLKVLRSFRQLEKIHLLPSGEVSLVEEDHLFDAQALVESLMIPTQYTTATATWACAPSLRILRMMIGGLPRIPSATGIHNVEAVLNMNSEIDLHRHIYRFLGSLTRLEELCLGFGRESRGKNEDDDSIFILPQNQARQEEGCLDFSLDSGLDLLNGLKSLRILNVARMNHRIGLREVQWMCQAWPHLGMIEGLLRATSLERVGLENGYDFEKSMDLIDAKRREEETVCWLKAHRPYMRFT